MTKTPTSDEHDEQVALCEWLDWRGVGYFAVPNAQHLGPKALGRLKKEGLKAGAPDLVLVKLVVDERYGLRLWPCAVEMKRKGGTVSDEQNATHGVMRDNGWVVVVAYGFDDARKQLEELGF